MKHFVLGLIASAGFLFGVVFPTSVYSLALKNINDQEITQIQDVFRRYQTLTSEISQTAIQGKNWRCDLYGVRTRLQVERNLFLYRFNQEGPQLRNKGAQPISQYRWTEIGLQGSHGEILDVIRFSPDRQNLVAELSVDLKDLTTTKVPETNSLVSPQRRVVAYALCK